MNIELRKLSLLDTLSIVKWRNSIEVKKNLYSQETITEQQHINYFKKYVETGKISQFIIVADGVDCGTVFLKKINLEKKDAEFGIFIGEKEYRGKGISSIATQKAIDYGFDILGLKKIYLTVFEDNNIAIKGYLKAGFVKTGLIKNGYCRNGVYYNIVEMAIEND